MSANVQKSITENKSNCVQNRVILLIIKDSVVYHRMANKMKSMIKAIDNDYEFDPYYNFDGFFAALNLLGITDPKNLGTFSGIFDDHIRNNEDTEAYQLAKEIYIDWLCEIKRGLLTKKVA